MSGTDARHVGTDFSLNRAAASALADVERGFRSAVDALTAHAAGGQGSATPLTASINRIAVCATAGDSVILPAAKAGASVVVVNSGAASANVFPATGETINAGSANAAFAVANGKTAAFYAPKDGAWFAILSA